MAKKRKPLPLPEQIQNSINRVSETRVELIGGYIEKGNDGGGCQTYGVIQLHGVRMISDSGLTQLLAEAEQRGYDRCMANLKATVNAAVDLVTK